VPESFKFHKTERLKKRTVINRMFKREGESFSIYPVRVIYLKTDLESPFRFQFAFSVPKRQFKKAVDRNRIRRKLFESLRLNRSLLGKTTEEDSSQDQYAVMLIYTGKEIPVYEKLEDCVCQVLNKLSKRLTAK